MGKTRIGEGESYADTGGDARAASAGAHSCVNLFYSAGGKERDGPSNVCPLFSILFWPCFQGGGHYREAVLDMFVFQRLSEVREQTERWLKEYNEERPHESLGHLTPREYLLTQQTEISRNSWV